MITLKKAILDDFDAYYKIKCGISDIYWNGFLYAPNKEILYNSYISRINIENPAIGDKEIYMILTEENDIVGYIQVSYNADDTELGFSIMKEFHGKGYGTSAIAEIMKIIDCKNVFARIREDNIASYRCFEKNGFVKTEKVEENYYPYDDKIFKFIRYVFNN